MIFLNRSEIDVKKWDDRIQASAIENIFCYSWYLDAVAENWGAILTDDYRTLLPVPFTKRLGVKQMYQAAFTREYDIFGTEFNWTDAVGFLSKHVKAIQFRNSAADLFPNCVIRNHQWLDLSVNYRQHYKENANRILKKGQTIFRVEVGSNIGVLSELFEKYVAGKIESIKSSDLVLLDRLMHVAMKQKTGELLVAKEEDQIVAAGFFLKDKKRITYLKGAATPAAMKSGVMYFLMDTAFRKYQADYRTFDFGGSEIPGVAQFFKKFGALDRIYYEYVLDNLPYWFKTLKKISK